MKKTDLFSRTNIQGNFSRSFRYQIAYNTRNYSIVRRISNIVINLLDYEIVVIIVVLFGIIDNSN